MLRLKVYVNENPIDEIRILNTGTQNKYGYYKYKVIMPEGFEEVIVWHDRQKGWPELVERVLKKLRKSHFNPQKWGNNKSLQELADYINSIEDRAKKAVEDYSDDIVKQGEKIKRAWDA